MGALCFSETDLREHRLAANISISPQQYIRHLIALAFVIMEELQSIGLGLVLGIVVVSLLSIFPGDPFDYDERDICVSSKTAAYSGSDTESVDDTCCDAAVRAVPEAEEARSASCSPSSPAAGLRKQRIKEIEKAAQEMKIQKLQELLGLEKGKMLELLERAKADAIKGVDPQSSSASVASYSAYLDFCFYAVTLGLLAVVLKTEYSIDSLHLLSYFFPREAETAQKLIAVPFRYLQQLFG